MRSGADEAVRRSERICSFCRDFKLIGALGVAMGMALVAERASADMAPPPPDDCPPGMVGQIGHGGSYCDKAPPKNCAPGYRGVIGGRCELATCLVDAQCEGAARCRAAQTCQEFREWRWTGWSWQAQAPQAAGNLFADAAREQPPGPPKQDWVELRICGQDGPCLEPAECRASKLCYSDASPLSTTPQSAAVPISGERPSGCGKGCAVKPSKAPHAGLLALFAVALLWRRLRARGHTHKGSAGANS